MLNAIGLAQSAIQSPQKCMVKIYSSLTLSYLVDYLETTDRDAIRAFEVLQRGDVTIVAGVQAIRAVAITIS